MAANYTATSRYLAHAYVCDASCVKRLPGIGSVSFSWVYQHRPKACRYAVVSQWDVVKHADQFIVWDLFEALRRLPSGELLPPKPRLVHDDLDAAIMATAMLYDMER